MHINVSFNHKPSKLSSVFNGLDFPSLYIYVALARSGAPLGLYIV